MAEFTKSLFRGILRGGNKESHHHHHVHHPNTPEHPEPQSSEKHGADGDSMHHDHAPTSSSAMQNHGEISIGLERMDSVTHEHSEELSATSDEDGAEDEVVKEGILTKWTNYVNGWQERYVVLKGGFLSYFKDKQDTKSLCRGTCSLPPNIYLFTDSPSHSHSHTESLSPCFSFSLFFFLPLILFPSLYRLSLRIQFLPTYLFYSYSCFFNIEDSL